MNLTLEKDGESKQITIYYYPLGRKLNNNENGLEVGGADEATSMTGKSFSSINGGLLQDSATTETVTTVLEHILRETDKLKVIFVAPPPKLIQRVHKKVHLSKLNRLIPRTNATVMKRVIGSCKKLGMDTYTCGWCNRRKIYMIDRYYHACLETKTLLCYQCYNDNTCYTPLYHDTKILPSENHFKNLWELNNSTPIPPLFQLLRHEFLQNIERPVLGSVDSLLGTNPPEIDSEFVVELTQFAEALLNNVLQQWSTLKQMQVESVFRWAILNENYESFNEIQGIDILNEKLNLLSLVSKVEDRKASKDLLQILTDIQERVLRDIMKKSEIIQLNRIPETPKQEVEIIKALLKVANKLNEVTEENPIPKRNLHFLKTLAENKIALFSGEEWVEFLLTAMNNTLLKLVINLPEEFYQMIIEYIFFTNPITMEEPKEPSGFGAPPSLSKHVSPSSLKRMASYTAIPKIDLQGSDVERLSKEQVEIMVASAESVDLFTLLEILRKDVHGFGMKGSEISQNGLAKLLNSYNLMSDESKPPISLFENTSSILVDRMIDLQFWDELDYVMKNCVVPEFLAPKFELFLIVFRLSSSIQDIELTKKMLESSNFSNISQVKAVITDIASSNHHDEFRKILKLQDQDRQQVLNCFQEEEMDFDVICPLCCSLPMTHTFECGHKVCEPCFRQLLETSKRCPFDRKAIC